MKRFRHKADKGLAYVGLAIFTVFFCWLFCLRYGIFGSQVDWISQHSVLPDYFRQQFYETGQLFPEFAANIGGGQNIYNFSYYGLYSPLVLLSYALPFVKMADYMMVVQLLSLMLSVMLLYNWLLRRGLGKDISFGTAVIFLLAGPMIFQSYSQIMFVNYMPFLCMGLLGVDQYFDSPPGNRRIGLFTFSVLCMILTSFYFSIGGMGALVLYGIHRYFMECEKEGRRVTIRMFLCDGIRFLLPMLSAVLMSSVLLIPTICALTGREGSGVKTDVWALLIPQVNVSMFCYSAYGIGLTTLGLTALLGSLAYRKLYERIFIWGLAAICMIPVFAYLLNGGLYVRDKVMIPFLPLLCYILAYYMKHLKNGVYSWAGCVPYLATILLIYIGRKQEDIALYWKWLLEDAVVMLLCYLVACRKKNIWLLMVPAIAFLVVFSGVYQSRENKAVDRTFYKTVTDQQLKEVTAEVASKERGFYRMEQLGTEEENAANLNRIWNMEQYSTSIYSSCYNVGYQEFRKKSFMLEQPFRNLMMQSVSRNPVYQRMMGVKYIISEDVVPGYQLYENYGSRDIYVNEEVSPVAYATDQVIGEEEYESLEFPYNQMVFLTCAVVKNDEKESQGGVRETCAVKEPENVIPVKAESTYQIQSDKKQTRYIDLPSSAEGAQRVLFCQFVVKNRKKTKDVAVWLEGIRNKLSARDHLYYNGNETFTYAVALKKGQQKAELVLGPGDYELVDAKVFLGVMPQKDAAKKLYQTEFQLDKEKTKGNVIAGEIAVQKDGYFVTTIPYDKQFEIRVDGEKVDKEEVNTAFLGCQIGKGEHKIEMVYHASGVREGKAVSVAGVVMFLVLAGCNARIFRSGKRA